MNLFKNQDGLIRNLLEVYSEYGNLVIGVDFDDTIRDYDTGEIISPVVEVLKESSELGMIICLYTVREEEELVYAKNFCKGINLKIDYYNSSPIITHTRKPLFNILLDDKAGLITAVEILKKVNLIITELKGGN